MFSVKITGRITGLVFIMPRRYSTRVECERSIANMKNANPFSYTIRSVHVHNVGQLAAAAS